MSFPNRRSRSRQRVPVYRNLSEPASDNQESIFASLARKHKRKPEIPVVSLVDDEEDRTNTSPAETANISEHQASIDDNDEIMIISDLEDGEILDSTVSSKSVISTDDVESSSSAITKPDGSKSRRTSSNSSSQAAPKQPTPAKSENEPEIICLSDAESDDDDIVIMGEHTVTEEKQVNNISRPNESNPFNNVHKLEKSIETAFSKVASQQHGIYPRFWRHTQSFPQKPNSEELRVCSYNVLCQLTIQATMYLYKHLSKNRAPLEWENRWRYLEEELLHIDADVFCLQEVQYDHYSSHFQPFMSQIGYGGFYKQKTGTRSDGCAIFYKNSKFSAINYRIVEYFVKNDTPMDKDQIGQILRLRSKSTGQDVIIANTHIIFNEQRGDIKIGQLALLFAHIDEEIKCGKAPIIIMGDFNMEPYSYVYTFISESKVFLKGLPRNELSGQGRVGGPVVQANNILPPESKVLRDSMFVGKKRNIEDDTFTHPFNLASVYSHINTTQKKDVSTSHIQHSNPDFIFYSVNKKVRSTEACQVFEDSKLRLLKYITLPDAESITCTTGPWPSDRVPSDHVPLVADFLLSK